MTRTVRTAYTVGAVGMVAWCAVMLVAGETTAAALSWLLGVFCFLSLLGMKETEVKE